MAHEDADRSRTVNVRQAVMDTILMAQQARKRSDITRRALLMSPMMDGSQSSSTARPALPTTPVLPPSPMLEGLPPSPVAQRLVADGLANFKHMVEEATELELEEEGVDTQCVSDDEAGSPYIRKLTLTPPQDVATPRLRTPRLTTPRTPRVRECTPRKEEWTSLQMAMGGLAAITALWMVTSSQGEKTRMYSPGRLRR